MEEEPGVFRSSNSNRRNVLKSFKMRRLAVICNESLSNLQIHELQSRLSARQLRICRAKDFRLNLILRFACRF